MKSFRGSLRSGATAAAVISKHIIWPFDPKLTEIVEV